MGLRVEVDELHAAGTRMTGAVAAPVTLGTRPVTPPATDQVSATAAAGLSAWLSAIGVHSARASAITSTAAGVLHANAGTYRDQEDRNAALLHPDGAASATSAGAATAAPSMTTALPPAPPGLPVAPPVAVMPTDGKAIATLIHDGPGPAALLAAASSARAHARELHQISTTVQSATDRLTVGWQSPAADTATTRIATLARWYDSHAEHTVSAARACEDHAEAFTAARSAIPRPEVFEDLERRLTAAARANIAARGAYTPVITALQTQLAATHSQAVTAYAAYATRTAGLGADSPTPAPPTVHALDDHNLKQSPPPDDPGNDHPWRDHPSPRTFDDVRDALRQLQRGDNKPHRQVDTPEEVRDFYDWLTGNTAGHPPPSKAPFPREQLDDGTVIGLRPDSRSGGETVVVTPPDGGKDIKVHLPTTPPIISAPPQLPPLGEHPPPAPALPHPVGPAPATLPPWLQNPALHGTPIPSQAPTIMPGVALPASPPSVPSAPAPGPALLPQIGHDLADAGEKIAVGALTGIAIIGGLLGIAAHPVTP